MALSIASDSGKLDLPLPEGGRRSVTILGSTGSIGCSTLDLIARNRDRFDLVALTAHRNVDALVAQAREHGPALAVIADETKYATLKEGLAGTGIEVAAGEAAVAGAAARPAEWVMASIVGAAGLAPTLAAVRRGACSHAREVFRTREIACGPRRFCRTLARPGPRRP